MRHLVKKARRVVVKVGSRTLASDREVFGRLADSIARAHEGGRSVVLVSSGAIALGAKKLGYTTRPKEMAKLQAAAAAGQSLLMRAYEEAFGARGLAVAQVLLTHADLADRARVNNARAALSALLEARAVPVLNENDSVSVEEIKFGDNDQLSALVAPLVDAELLVLLSDIPGLLDADGERVPVVRDIATEAVRLVRSGKSAEGTGGMASKLEAARLATLTGAQVVIADARAPDVLDRVLAGDDVGTWFVAPEKRLSAKRAWIAFTLRPRGALVLDPGAARAVTEKGKSVLSVGVLGVRGDFRAGDAVRLLSHEGVELGRGLSRLAVEAATRLAGTKSSAPAAPKAGAAKPAAKPDDDLDVLVHRDELVVFARPQG
ncbi:MAG TPA: glutamate 5-kinase [Polyangiaceae bacterium]|nr:glutamate 5-kinase [Polyangiaceae bacterium]